MDLTTSSKGINNKPKVNVIGAGVAGLTTALILQQNGFQVKVLAEHFPGDLNIEYDNWGTGLRLDVEDENELEQKFSAIGFKAFWLLATHIPDAGVRKMMCFDYTGWVPETPNGKPWLKDVVSDFKVIPRKELPPGCEYGVAYTTITLNVPKYHCWLLRQFRNNGGVTENVRLSHVMEAFDPDVDVVVNCTGVQARTFGGVEDKNVYPTRGQTVVVWAPHVKKFMTRRAKDGELSYIIPCDDGHVILGGTLQHNDYNEKLDKATAERILQSCTNLYPELARGRGFGALEILTHNVGLRPTRKGGIRLETETRRTEDGRLVVICHNYGHHNSGYTTSWGCSAEALRLIQEAVKHLERRNEFLYASKL